MATVMIEDKDVQTKRFVEYACLQPYATGVAEKKMSFEEAAIECKGISVDAFYDELDERIKRRFNA
jgi:predicted HTH domain antitoxin